MIILSAIVVGLAAGLVWARLLKRAYQLPPLKLWWMVFVAVIPQLLAFSIAATRTFIPDWAARSILIISQVLLLIFVWLNRQNLGMVIIGAGLILNFVVIVANGGFMPMTPEKLLELRPDVSTEQIPVGERSGYGKDIILEKDNTKIWFLSDIFSFPSGFPYRVAFSAGDVVLALGVVWFLAAPDNKKEKE
jgi:multisubunit Na+/H+ antiporter MnhC subunit